MTDTARPPTPRQIATAALKADRWVNAPNAVKVVFDAFDAAGVTVGNTRQLTADDLSENVDLCMTCVGLALGAAGAMLTGDEAAEGMAAVLELWPDEVPDAALTVGLRVALAIAAGHGFDANDLGTVAAQILDTEHTEQEETTSE